MNSKMRVLVFLFFVFVSFSFLIYYEYADIVKQDVMQEKNIDVSNENNGVNNQSNSYVIINNYTIDVELALTNEERQKGLMGREILNDNEINQFSSIGEKFNPELHEALMSEPGKESNIILKEFEKGYMYNDKILRHAKVVVSKS